MRIIKEDTKTLHFSFYLIGKDERAVGVWMRRNEGGGIFYYRYGDNFCLDETRKGISQSSELDFLLCIGYTANEMYQKGLKEKKSLICEVLNRRL